MKNIKCPHCNEKQWSISDCNYLILFGTCWSCDKKRWEKKELLLEEFELRETQAIESKEL